MGVPLAFYLTASSRPWSALFQLPFHAPPLTRIIPYCKSSAKISILCIRDPDTRFSASVLFMKQLPLGPWYTGELHRCAINFVEYLREWPEALFFCAEKTVWLGCTQHSSVIDTAVTCTVERYQWHRCNMQSSIIDTAVTRKSVSMTPMWNTLYL
jgi:hypothetical protein